MEKLPGERGDTFKYFSKGYMYHKDKANKKGQSKVTYRCATRSTTHCVAYAEENDSGEIELFGIHCDQPMIEGATISRLKTQMLHLSKTTLDSFDAIHKKVLEG